MSIEQNWGVFFKSEIKSSGFKLFIQEKISLASGSDTDVQAYVRVAPPFKVHLHSTEIENPSFIAECTCPMAKKYQFCKHVWATLLCVEKKYPDFLQLKRVIEKPESVPREDLPATEQGSFQVAAKLRAADYRKLQYQKQKLRVKELKLERQGAEKHVSKKAFSPEVEAALAYFSQNGFPMEGGPIEATVGEARRKLSRVFHPDKGGTTEEMVELNRNSELLLQFLGA